LDELRGKADRSCDQPPPPLPAPADLELFGERTPREPLEVAMDEVGLVTGEAPTRPKPSKGESGPEEVDEVEWAVFWWYVRAGSVSGCVGCGGAGGRPEGGGRSPPLTLPVWYCWLWLFDEVVRRMLGARDRSGRGEVGAEAEEEAAMAAVERAAAPAGDRGELRLTECLRAMGIVGIRVGSVGASGRGAEGRAAFRGGGGVEGRSMSEPSREEPKATGGRGKANASASPSWEDEWDEDVGEEGVGGRASESVAPVVVLLPSLVVVKVDRASPSSRPSSSVSESWSRGPSLPPSAATVAVGGRVAGEGTPPIGVDRLECRLKAGPSVASDDEEAADVDDADEPRAAADMDPQRMPPILGLVGADESEVLRASSRGGEGVCRRCCEGGGGREATG